ncbi:MAG TPA: nuclear transport factor 2 family protein [Rhizobacter sp.]|nr:nuclear transport factor 2 family protein [Rhizobacter sp.]
MNAEPATEREAVSAVLQLYFDGLHHSDTQRLRRVFHPRALYASASDGTLLALGMDQYFAVVDQRVSPASRGDARTDRILAIEFAGPVTALARVQCSILPRHFIDLLTLVKLDGRWQVIAKVFHHAPTPEGLC